MHNSLLEAASTRCPGPFYGQFQCTEGRELIESSQKDFAFYGMCRGAYHEILSKSVDMDVTLPIVERGNMACDPLFQSSNAVASYAIG